jgi:hypothetical protein
MRNISNPVFYRYIPVGDAPPAWGDDNIEVARHRVQEARRIVKNTSKDRTASDAACVIQ